MARGAASPALTLAPQEHRTEERRVGPRDGVARLVTLTDLTTGVAHWTQSVKGVAEKAVPPLSEVAIRKVFLRFDTNKTGALSKKELRRALGELGLDLTAGEASAVLREADADGSGALSTKEFVVLCQRLGAVMKRLPKALAARPARAGEPLDRFDVESCRRWVVQHGLRPGAAGMDFAGNYPVKGLYAYSEGEFGGVAFFGTGGDAVAMDAQPRVGQYRPHLEGRLDRPCRQQASSGAAAARAVSSASRADGKAAPMAKLDASLGRSIAGGTAVPSASAIAREGPPLPRSAPSSAIAAAVGRSIARPTNGGSGEYQYDVRLQMLQARRLALHRGSRPIRTFEDGFAGPSNDAEAQAELPTPPSPTGDCPEYLHPASPTAKRSPGRGCHPSRL
mmetsp:Transcript_33177/g.98733  ORF Transcript_33177/g.98733 Transcript_33177/m.98733 type:complete len:393 (+) Transcript_33177:392-1570(+)